MRLISNFFRQASVPGIFVDLQLPFNKTYPNLLTSCFKPPVATYVCLLELSKAAK